jgi:hypothetical protein
VGPLLLLVLVLLLQLLLLLLVLRPSSAAAVPVAQLRWWRWTAVPQRGLPAGAASAAGAAHAAAWCGASLLARQSPAHT